MPFWFGRLNTKVTKMLTASSSVTQIKFLVSSLFLIIRSQKSLLRCQRAVKWHQYPLLATKCVMMPTQIIYCICIYCRYWLCFLLMCFLHVESPTVTVASYPVPVLQGGNVTLICNTTGTPPLFIEWTKVNDSTVLSSTSALTLYSVSRPGTPSEIAEYRCTAKNGYGDPASAEVTVQVFCKYIFHFILMVKIEVLCIIIWYD